MNLTPRQRKILNYVDNMTHEFGVVGTVPSRAIGLNMTQLRSTLSELAKMRLVHRGPMEREMDYQGGLGARLSRKGERTV